MSKTTKLTIWTLITLFCIIFSVIIVFMVYLPIRDELVGSIEELLYLSCLFSHLFGIYCMGKFWKYQYDSVKSEKKTKETERKTWTNLCPKCHSKNTYYDYQETCHICNSCNNAWSYDE